MQIKKYFETEDHEWLPMVGSEALGLPLVKQGNFAADMLKFEPYQQTSLHTHPGNHILFVVEGDGWLDYGDETLDLTTGTCYFVPGSTPHRVKSASIGMVLMSISDSHYPVDSSDRLEVINA